MQTNEEAQIYFHDLGLFVTVQLREDTPAILSLGKLCEEHGYSYEWQTEQTRKKITFRTDKFLPFVIPDLSASSGTASSSTSPVQDVSLSSSITERSDEPALGNWREAHQITKNQQKKEDDDRDSDERLRDLPEWLEEFTDNLEHRDACARAHYSGLRFGTSYESGIKIQEAQYLYSLPERPKLRSMLANEDDKGSLQTTQQ